MLFMLRGLYSSWKLPLAYFICKDSMPHDVLKTLLCRSVGEATRAGLKVRAVICDQGTNNQAALKSLNIAVERPFFLLNDSKIISIFDVPHLFKNWRNHWLVTDFSFCGNTVSFDDVRKSYEIDLQSTTARSLTKITANHIDPGPFQKMNCSLDLQIFSRSMATSIKTAVDTGQLTSKTALHTAEFIELTLIARTLLTVHCPNDIH